MSHFLNFLFKYQKIIWGVVLLLTIISGLYFIKHINQVDNSLPVWFSKNDPDYQTYQKFLKEFEPDRFVMVAFSLPGDVFEKLSFIEKATKTFEALKDVEKVQSLTNLTSIDFVGDTIQIQPVIQKEKILHTPYVVGRLITKDSKTANFILTVNTGHSYLATQELKKQMFGAINQINPDGFPFYVSGAPIIEDAFNHYVIRDQRLFFPATIAICILFLILLFRQASLALVALVVQGAVVIWILALYYLFGKNLNIVSGMVCPILVTSSIISIVHVIFEFKKDFSIHNALSRIWWPCVYAALTTIVGFFSFFTSSIPPLRLLGYLTSLGVMLTVVISFVLIPLVLNRLKESKTKPQNHFSTKKLDRFLEYIAQVSSHHHIILTLMIGVVLVFSYLGVTRLKIETNFFEYFFKNQKVRQDLLFFEKNLGGIGSFEIVLASQHEIAKNPEVLKEIQLFKEWIITHPLTQSLTSPVDYLVRLNSAINQSDKPMIPTSQKEVAELFELAGSGGLTELEKYITPDYQKIRLSLRSHLVGSEQLGFYLKEIKTHLEKQFYLKSIQISLTGYGPLWVRLDRDILNSQLSSMGWSFAVIAGMMMLFLRSIKLGLIGLAPNIVSIFITLGIMGFLKIHLNVATVMIAAITMGLIVDDTIYYLTRFKENLKELKSYPEAIKKTHQEMGKTIIFVSVILAAGFAILGFGSFTPTVYFGSMVALTILIAIFCELIILPILLIWFKPIKI